MASDNELLARIDERTQHISEEVTEIKAVVTADHDRLGKVEAKVNGFAVLQAAFTALAASIAGWLGVRR